MADTIDIIIKGRDQASAAFDSTRESMDGMSESAEKGNGAFEALSSAASTAATAGLAVLGAAVVTVGAGLVDVNARAAEARNVLQGLDDVNMDQVLNDATLLEARYGEDMQSVLAATRTLMDEFGLSSEEANNIIIAGFDKGLNTSGDFLDSIGEYSNLFAQNGASAEQFFSTLESGLAGGALGTDKAADLFKEFGIRIQDGSTATATALQSLNLGYLTEQLSTGKITAVDAFGTIQEALRNVQDPLLQAQLGTALFGTQFEDLGASAALGISTATTSMADLTAAAETGRNTFTTFGEIGPRIWGEFTTALLPASDALLKLANDNAPAISAAIGQLGVVLGEAATKFGPLITGFLDGSAATGPFGDIIDRVWPILEQVGNIAMKTGEWFTTSLVPALTTAGTAFATMLAPHLDKAAELMQTYLLPAIESIAGWIGENLPQAIGVVAPIITGLVDVGLAGLLAAFEGVGLVWTNVLSPAFTAMSGFLGRLTGGWENLTRGATAARDLLSGLGKIISDFASKTLPSWLTGGIKLPGIKLPGFAEGVTNFGGGMAVVGERGPEIVNLPRGSDVIPAGPSARIMAQPQGGTGGRSVSMQLTIAPVIQGAIIDNEQRLNQLAQRIAQQARDMIASELGNAVDELILGSGVA